MDLTGDFMQKFLEALHETPTGAVVIVKVHHDEDCSIWLDRGLCDCSPEIALLTEKVEVRDEQED